MDIKTIYKKYNKCESLSDAEVVFAEQFFDDLYKKLQQLGAEFAFPAREALRMHNAFYTFRNARGLKIK